MTTLSDEEERDAMRKRLTALLALSCLILCACGQPGSDKDAQVARESVTPDYETPALRIGMPDDTMPDPELSGSTEAELDENVPEQTLMKPQVTGIDTIIDGMSLKEQVSQLFIISLGDRASPSDELEAFVDAAEAGGYILFKENITTVERTMELTEAVAAYSAIAPFICIDEEGGEVSRLRSARLPGYEPQRSARDIGATGDTLNAFSAGETIGGALASIGVNVDFAPVVDVLTNTRNKVIGSRAFGSDPGLVGDMASAFREGLQTHGIMSAPKHFPGHGNTVNDSHSQRVEIDSDTEHLASVEYVPFMRLIDEGAEFIMVGHIVAPEVTSDGLPATLSEHFISDVLRFDLGFDGIIVTDAMNMGAITLEYSSAKAAVMALQAGADMILMPQDFDEAVKGVMDSVDAGTLSPDRIRESLVRVLEAKINAGLIAINNN